MEALCRDCLHLFDVPEPVEDAKEGARSAPARCPACGSPRTRAHAELTALFTAHIDCDAFYATVEKRDDPALRDVPLIVGGGRRGVVTTCCYLARTRGVRSAQPMFQALKLCPDAVVVPPRFEAYIEVSRAIRDRFLSLTPLVEPLSLDEAFLDLAGTARLHGPPAQALARLAAEIERDIGVTVSIGLSHNKFLAKIASDLDKPRGFSIIGLAETAEFLAEKPVSILWGIGQATTEKLNRDGYRTLADLRRADRRALGARYGALGDRLWRLSHGEDARAVTPNSAPKSISNETTFSDDVSDPGLLDGHLWRMAEKAAARAKAKGLAGRTVTLKLKRADHRLLTRRTALSEPVQLADRVYRAARPLLVAELPRGPFRLLGVGLSDLAPEEDAERSADLLDPEAGRRGDAERAADKIRARFGADAILKGRSLR